MDVTQALRQRRSVRAFLPDAPPAALVQTLTEGDRTRDLGGSLGTWEFADRVAERLVR